MALVAICCAVLLVLTTVIHYEVLRMLAAGLPRVAMPSRAKLTIVIFGTFVAHTTGPTNLVAHALCRDTAALYQYLTRGLGAVKAIRTLETAPVLRTLKAVGTITPAGPARVNR